MAKTDYWSYIMVVMVILTRMATALGLRKPDYVLS